MDNQDHQDQNLAVKLTYANLETGLVQTCHQTLIPQNNGQRLDNQDQDLAVKLVPTWKPDNIQLTRYVHGISEWTRVDTTR